MQTKAGITPLMLCILSAESKKGVVQNIKTLEIIKVLLAAKASVIHQDNRGLTALHIAAERNLPEVIDLLLPHLEAHHINAITKHMKLTPLMVAVHHNAMEAVKKLLENKHCDKYKKDLVGYFPLHYAVVNKSKEMVELILKHSEEMSSYFEENGVHQNVLDTSIVSVLKKKDRGEKLPLVECIFQSVGAKRKLASYGDVRQVVELLIEQTNEQMKKKKKQGTTPYHEQQIDTDATRIPYEISKSEYQFTKFFPVQPHSTGFHSLKAFDVKELKRYPGYVESPATKLKNP